MLLLCFVSDVNAICTLACIMPWLMLFHTFGRCCCHKWQMTTGSIYFNLSSDMLHRTSSHICGRWYLPMFLLWFPAFLDILITPKEDGRLSTPVYRKPTHTDFYLQWDSCHPIPSKYTVVGTLYHRDKTICFSPQLLQEE